jgi:hypothetical protein
VAVSVQSSRPRGRGGLVAPWVALGALMATASALILYMGRGTTFFRDEWTFMITRDGHDATNFLSSYAGHLLLWPVAFFLFMFKAVGLDHYELYRLAALPWHLACALFVYLLARRRIGGVAALAPAGVLLFLGSSWMNLLWPFQIAFTGAIAFGLAAILALDRDDLPGDALACLSLLVAIGWSGVSLPFLAVVAAGLLIRRRFWRRLWVPALPAVVYLLWLTRYGDQQIDYAASLLQTPGYALKMAGAGITGISGLPAALGPYLAVLFGLCVAVRLQRLGRSSPLAWEALAGAVAFWGLTAVARVQEHDPTASRYIYPSAVFILLLAVGLAPLGAPRRGVTVAILALAVLTLPSNLAGFRAGRSDLRFSSNIASAELGAVQLGGRVAAPEYTPELNGFSGVPAAYFLSATYRFGSSPADSPDEIADSPEYARRHADDTLIAALRVRLHAAPAHARLSRDPIALRVGAGTVASRRGGCARLDSRAGGLTADGVLPAEGVLIESASSPASVALRRFARDFHRLSPSVTVAGADTLRIVPDEDRRRPWHVRVLASGGPVTVCRLAPARSAPSRAGISR